MNKTQEALKMAIEALEEAKKQLWCLPTLEKLIQDCKEALEQPEQKPMAWMSKMGSFTAIAETKKQLPKGTEPIPLYTHPHQWQGVTEKEILIICAKMAAKLPNKEIDIIFARAIEQALKEKHNGYYTKDAHEMGQI